MKDPNSTIEYFFLKRSAVQFREDLTDVARILDSLSEEQIFIIASYIDAIKVKIKHIERNLAEKFLHNSDSD